MAIQLTLKHKGIHPLLHPTYELNTKLGSARVIRLFLFSLVWLLCLFSHQCQASDDQRFVGFECSSELQMFRLSYHTSNVHVNFSEGYLVDTFYLKRNDPSGAFVQSVREVVKPCTISGVRYVARLRGKPGNYRLNGECGGWTGAGARIFRNDKMILDVDFDSCRNETVLTSLTYLRGSAMPAVTTSSQDRFVKGQIISCSEKPQTNCIPSYLINHSRRGAASGTLRN